MKKKLFSTLLLLCLVMVSAGFLLRWNNVQSYPVVIRYDYPVVKTAEGLTSEAEEIGNEAAEVEPAVINSQREIVFPLELNHVTLEELMLIPTIGGVTGSRIVEYREHIGGYTQLEQLMEIKGIAKGTFAEISRYLYLEGDSWDNPENESS